MCCRPLHETSSPPFPYRHHLSVQVFRCISDLIVRATRDISRKFAHCRLYFHLCMSPRVCNIQTYRPHWSTIWGRFEVNTKSTNISHRMAFESVFGFMICVPICLGHEQYQLLFDISGPPFSPKYSQEAMASTIKQQRRFSLSRPQSIHRLVLSMRLCQTKVFCCGSHNRGSPGLHVAGHECRHCLLRCRWHDATLAPCRSETSVCPIGGSPPVIPHLVRRDRL